MIIQARIDMKKIDKNHLYAGEKGVYLAVSLLENRDGRDRYGNDFMVVQSVNAVARANGERGPILGNAKIAEVKADPEDVAAVLDTAEVEKGAQLKTMKLEAGMDDVPF